MEIIFAGASHYGIGGYRSLFPYFEKIYLIRDCSKEIINIKRIQDKVINDFNEVSCKYVFLCGYSKLISGEYLERKKYINVHGALLPKYRGMHSTFYAIMNGEKELGITFHLVNQYMDAGDILAQYSFPYTGQYIRDINDSIDELVYKYSGAILKDFLSDNIKPVPQNDDEAIFGAKRNLNDCIVDFTMPNKMLRRFFKAMTPNYPYPMLKIRGELYEILPKTKIEDRLYFGPLGRAVYINEQGVWIKVKDGFLIVSNVRKYGSDNIIYLSELIPIGYRFENIN